MLKKYTYKRLFFICVLFRTRSERAIELKRPGAEVQSTELLDDALAESFGLVVWSHATAWQAQFAACANARHQTCRWFELTLEGGWLEKVHI